MMEATFGLGRSYHSRTFKVEAQSYLPHRLSSYARFHKSVSSHGSHDLLWDGDDMLQLVKELTLGRRGRNTARACRCRIYIWVRVAA